LPENQLKNADLENSHLPTKTADTIVPFYQQYLHRQKVFTAGFIVANIFGIFNC
jgi:hypothetical protein